MATQMQREVFFDGKSQGHPRLVKQRQLKSQKRQNCFCIRVVLSIKLRLNCHVHKFGIRPGTKRK